MLKTYYPNGRIMKEPIIVYDEDGNVDGMETRIYNNDGTIRWLQDRWGALSSLNLQEYWTTFERYYYSTTTICATAEELVAVIGDPRITTHTSLPLTGKMSRFSSFTGGNNQLYNGYVALGIVQSSIAPSSSTSWFTGYSTEGLECLMTTDGVCSRQFQRFEFGQPKETLTITFSTNISQ